MSEHNDDMGGSKMILSTVLKTLYRDRGKDMVKLRFIHLDPNVPISFEKILLPSTHPQARRSAFRELTRRRE